MPNVKISAATDAGTLLSSDMLPLARSGDTNAYHATMAEIATYTGASVASGAYGNVGRNQIHNGLFNISQRGVGPFTSPSFTLDRWFLANNADTVNLQQVAMTDANRTAIGDEAATNAVSTTFTGTSGAGAYSLLGQSIEGVRRLGGKTVTVSFWAAATATLNLGVFVQQAFGSGGSPSATVIAGSHSVVLTTAWGPRYSMTFTLPSTSGKTLGTNNDSSTQMFFCFSAGSTNGPAYGNPGVQSGSIALWGVQLEIGSVATPLEKVDIQTDWLRCLRFYQNVSVFFGGYQVSGQNIGAFTTFSPPMRATPSITLGSFTNTNVGTLSVGANPTGLDLYGPVTATGTGVYNGNILASADL